MIRNIADLNFIFHLTFLQIHVDQVFSLRGCRRIRDIRVPSRLIPGHCPEGSGDSDSKFVLNHVTI